MLNLSRRLWPEHGGKGPQILFLLAVAATLGFTFQGARGIWEPDEGCYIPIAAAMYDSGDLLVPRLSGEPFLDKPPLTYWGMVGCMHLFGRNEFGARAYHAFCYVATVLLASLLASSFWGRRDGLLAGLSYATMAGSLGACNVITPDTPLALWVAAAFYCFWRSLSAQSKRATGLWKVLLGGAMGLGFLTKGPAVLVFAGALFLYLALQRRLAEYFITPWAMPAFVLFCAVALPWYGLISRSLPGGLAFMFENQVTGRLITAHYGRHPEFLGAFSVYGPMFFAGTLPWSAAWPLLLWRARERIRGTQFPIQTLTFWPGGLNWDCVHRIRQFIKERPVLLLLLCWAIFPLLVFCLASSKLELYILPTFPALALLTSRGLSRLVLKQRAGIPPRLLVALGIYGILMLGVKLGAAYVPHGKDSRAVWLAIKDHLPDTTCPIFAVDSKMGGICFYCTNPVYTLDRGAPQGIFYSEARQYEDELKATVNSKTPRVFVVSRDESRLPIRKRMRELGVEFKEFTLPLQRALLVCEPRAFHE